MSSYENHLFEKGLPIIFHLDRLKENQQCVNNWHENLELIYCIEGQGEAVINSKHTLLSKGDILVINSGDIHYITALSETLSYYCLIISTAFLQEYGMNAENTSFCEYITDNSFTYFFETISGELSEKKPYYHSAVKGAVLSCAAELFRGYTTEKKENINQDKIKRGLTYIREHFTEELDVEVIARHAGFSRFYFSRQFKETTGLTVMKYVEFLRCRHARELLEDGWPVSKAALECGFKDISYFTKVFKRQFGVLPSKLRSK